MKLDLNAAHISLADKLSDDLTSALEAGFEGLGQDEDYDFNDL